MRKLILPSSIAILLLAFSKANACTGISLQTKRGEFLVARTIEWALSPLESSYVIVPRGYSQQALLPDGTKDGMSFTSRYGYVGLSVEQDEFVMEGINEEGFSAGLFYFPSFGEYEEFDKSKKERTINDFQLVSWLLGSCKTVDEAIEALQTVHIVGIDPRASTVHWRIAEKGGRQIVVEIIDKQLKIYENAIGVLSNAPSFDWHLTNLNNYINLQSGNVNRKQMGGVTLRALGAGTGLLGLPGDMTPPSRFVRAAFLQTTAPKQETSEQAVTQAFHILNSFDAPIGLEAASGEATPNIPSATQWTVVSDLTNGRIYYRTMYNSRPRCIDLCQIRFDKVKFQSAPLDKSKNEDIEYIRVKS